MINVWIFHYCICFTFWNILLYVCKYNFSRPGHWPVYTDLGHSRLCLLSERGRESRCALPRQPHDAAQSCRKNSTEPIPSCFPGHLPIEKSYPHNLKDCPAKTMQKWCFLSDNPAMNQSATTLFVEQPLVWLKSLGDFSAV